MRRLCLTIIAIFALALAAAAVPLRVPCGGTVRATDVTLPAGEWASFRVGP